MIVLTPNWSERQVNHWRQQQAYPWHPTGVPHKSGKLQPSRGRNETAVPSLHQRSLLMTGSMQATAALDLLTHAIHKAMGDGALLGEREDDHIDAELELPCRIESPVRVSEAGAQPVRTPITPRYEVSLC
jgi:hypothetical protein